MVSPIGEVTFDKEEPIENLTTWVYENGSFVPIGKLTDNESFSIVSDYLGTPVQAYDQSGNLIWERELDIYGRVRKLKGDKDFCNFLYQGQYYDKEIELAYNRFRYYSPETGSYISQDPIGLAGGLAFYAYVHDVNGWVDVLGLAKGDILEEGLVYRAGGNTLNNYTPSLPKDINGLSMFNSTDILKERLPKADKAQIIDLSKLGNDLIAIDDGDGHISIKPRNDINNIEMKKWGALKGNNELPNPLAEQIQKARIDSVKLCKG